MRTHEFELKFGLNMPDAQLRPETLTLLQALGLENLAGQQVYSAYWDTPDRVLGRQRAALRIRRSPAGWVQTIKGEGLNPFERIELEWPVAAPRPDLSVLRDAPSYAVVRSIRDHFPALAPVFETDFIRRKQLGGAFASPPYNSAALRYELALDQGEVRANGLRACLYELELELISGPAQLLLQRAARWAALHGLTLRQTSKALAGARLGGEETPPVSPAKRPRGHQLAATSPRARALRLAGLAESLVHLEAGAESWPEARPRFEQAGRLGLMHVLGRWPERSTVAAGYRRLYRPPVATRQGLRPDRLRPALLAKVLAALINHHPKTEPLVGQARAMQILTALLLVTAAQK